MAPLMSPGPPKILEDLAKVLIPPSCREEVLGDLYERYKSPPQYVGDLVSTLPFVILGRIMRTTPVRLLLMEAVLVYVSFLAAAWYVARTVVMAEGGLVRLAISSGLALMYLLISDAFTGPRQRSTKDRIRPLAVKLALVVLCYFAGLLTEANIYGFCLSLTLAGTARLMFDPETPLPQGAGWHALLAGRQSRPVSRTVIVRVTLALLALICLIGLEMLSRRGVIP